jgi:hypothetical protein
MTMVPTAYTADCTTVTYPPGGPMSREAIAQWTDERLLATLHRGQLGDGRLERVYCEALRRGLIPGRKCPDA